MKSNKIKSLIKLLDDDNPRTANLIMAELLSMEREIDPIVANLQESREVKLRQKSHQMQAILKIRRRRHRLADKLKSSEPNLFQGLIELHLQWFDEDSDSEIYEFWTRLFKSAAKFNPVISERLGKFMKGMLFTLSNSEELDAAQYCLGAVIESRTGADFILCAIAAEIGHSFGWEGNIVYTSTGFALLDNAGKMLLPSESWSVKPMNIKDKYTKWSNKMLLKLAISNLFLCAAGTESIRYMHTLGSCLSNSFGKKELNKILPYPYGIINY